MLEMKIRINTPDGLATKVESKLRWILFKALGKVEYRTEIKSDRTILWFVTCNPKQFIRLHKAILIFNKASLGVFNNSVVNKLIKSNVDKPEDYDLLKELFKHHTKVEIIKDDLELDKV